MPDNPIQRPQYNEFANQLESIYRGGDIGKPSRPISDDAFRTTNAQKAASQFEKALSNTDAGRQAAIERNNAILDQRQRQTAATRLQQQEAAALERLRQSRLGRTPLELDERLNPRARTAGIGASGSSSSAGGAGGGGAPRIPGGGRGGVPGGAVLEVPPGTPRPSLPNPFKPPPGAPSMRLPALPNLPRLPSLPPGLGMALGRGAGIVGFVPALKDAFDRQQHLNERFQEILFPPPPAQPGFNRLPNVPSRPTPPPAPPGVPGGNTDGQYAVTIRSVATNVDSGEQTVSNFTLTTGGPIWGIRTQSDADTLSYFLISGELAQTAIPIGGASGTRAAEVLTVTIANIQRLDAPTDPDTRPPYPQPQRTFPPAAPGAPQYPQRQPIGAPPSMRPDQPPGTPAAPSAPGTPAAPSAPGSPRNPAAPAFPSSPPGQPTQPGQPFGFPLPLPLGMPVGAPGARSGGGAASAGGGAPGTANPNNPMPSPDAAPDTPATPTPPPTNTPNPICRFEYDLFVRDGVTRANTGIGTANAKITAVEAAQIALDAFIARETATINNKLGDQIPKGGIGGKLGRISGMISKLYNNLGIDRALAVFTWIGVVHNAYMLSNSLAQTLFSAIGSSLDAIGIQKMDEDGNESPYEVGEMVAKYTDNAMKTLFGVETWNGIKDTWRKYNRIYQAAANIINAMQSMMQSMLQALEIIGQYVSKIGNAAKTFGVFAENCYSWMAPNFNFMGGKFFRFMNGAQDVLENIDQVAQEVVNIQQTAGELQKQQTELNKAVADATEEKTKVEERQKAESRGAAVTANDERKPNP